MILSGWQLEEKKFPLFLPVLPADCCYAGYSLWVNYHLLPYTVHCSIDFHCGWISIRNLISKYNGKCQLVHKSLCLLIYCSEKKCWWAMKRSNRLMTRHNFHIISFITVVLYCQISKQLSVVLCDRNINIQSKSAVMY